MFWLSQSTKSLPTPIPSSPFFLPFCLLVPLRCCSAIFSVSPLDRSWTGGSDATDFVELAASAITPLQPILTQTCFPSPALTHVSRSSLASTSSQPCPTTTRHVDLSARSARAYRRGAARLVRTRSGDRDGNHGQCYRHLSYLEIIGGAAGMRTAVPDCRGREKSPAGQPAPSIDSLPVDAPP